MLFGRGLPNTSQKLDVDMNPAQREGYLVRNRSTRRQSTHKIDRGKVREPASGRRINEHILICAAVGLLA